MSGDERSGDWTDAPQDEHPAFGGSSLDDDWLASLDDIELEPDPSERDPALERSHDDLSDADGEPTDEATRSRRRGARSRRSQARRSRSTGKQERPARKGKRRAGAKDTPRRDASWSAGGGPATGPRTERRRRRLRRARTMRISALVVLAIAVMGVALVPLLTGVQLGTDTPAEEAPPPAADGSDQRTLLLVRHGPTGEAIGVTLLAADRERAEGVVLFLPVGTLVDIPGHGLDRLGAAWRYGDGQPVLLRAAVESTLGIVIDHVASFDDADLAAWLGRMEGVEVTIPERLVRRDAEGVADVRFEAGAQVLDGSRLAELWGFRARADDELEGFPRQQLVLSALLDRVADDEDLAGELAADSGGPLGATAEEDWLADFLVGLSDARDAGELRYALLPVELVGGEAPDGSSAYRIVRGATADLVDDVLAGSVPAGGGRVGVRVEVLNGVGEPGVGAQVDARLDPGRFRLVRADNANRFDYTETLVVIYDETPEMLDAAAAVQEALGVGTIRVSRQPQSVVDLTVVVGSDFTGTPPLDLDPDSDDLDQTDGPTAGPDPDATEDEDES